MRIGVLCSGGDSPGMNSCLRAVVRSALASGHQIAGICRGYQGLLDEDLYCENGQYLMTYRSVSGISQRGGALLRSSRSEEFKSEVGLRRAAGVLNKHGIEGLVVIGGDGTFRGALELADYWSGQIIGCPGTIDNDLTGTDFTIGFSTAVETAVQAVDKIRDTAESHERMFLVEVMGRKSGFLAVYTALAAAAESVCIPETPTDIDRLIKHLNVLKERGKFASVMVVAEGDEVGGAMYINEMLKSANCPFATRVVILGHIQRGGSPTPEDRILASRIGRHAVDAILSGRSGMMAGVIGNQCRLTPFQETFDQHKPIPSELLDLLGLLTQ